MKRTIERSLAVLLALGGAGHAFGSYTAFQHAPITLLWSLCAALFLFLLAALNWLRAIEGHENDGWDIPYLGMEAEFQDM